MKLFTYLIIDHDIIENTQLFKRTHYRKLKNKKKHDNEYAYSKDDLLKGNAKDNRIYVYREDERLVFMSFKYPNINRLSLESHGCEWAYTLIDEVTKPDIMKERHWSTNLDKRNKKPKDADITFRYLRIGGHLGHGTKGKSNIRLHEFILQKNYVVIEKGMLTHHKGHSFDNRRNYLMENVCKAVHSKIHSEMEPARKYYRPRRIVWGSSFTDKLKCDCNLLDIKERKKACLSCEAVLHIKTEEQLKEFIAELKSKEYTDLEARGLYKGSNNKK